MRLYTLLKKIIDRITQVGIIYTSSDIGEKTVGTGGYHNIGSLTLKPGTYLIEGSCQFDISSEDSYNLALMLTGSAMALYRGKMWGGGSGNVSRIYRVTQTRTFYLAVYNGSSSSRTVKYPRFQAVRLRGGVILNITRRVVVL